MLLVTVTLFLNESKTAADFKNEKRRHKITASRKCREQTRTGRYETMIAKRKLFVASQHPFYYPVAHHVAHGQHGPFRVVRPDPDSFEYIRQGLILEEKSTLVHDDLP